MADIANFSRLRLILAISEIPSCHRARGEQTENNLHALPEKRGQGKARDDNPLALFEGEDQGRAISDNPQAHPKKKGGL